MSQSACPGLGSKSPGKKQIGNARGAMVTCQIEPCIINSLQLATEMNIHKKTMLLPLTFVESEYTLSSIVRSRKKPEQIIYVT